MQNIKVLEYVHTRYYNASKDAGQTMANTMDYMDHPMIHGPQVHHTKSLSRPINYKRGPRGRSDNCLHEHEVSSCFFMTEAHAITILVV